MHILPSYSMLASTTTTFMLSMIFLILSKQSGKNYMRLWGTSWLIYSIMFLLDFLNLRYSLLEVSYIMLRQMIALAGSFLFLLGTYRFFQLKVPSAVSIAAVVSCVTIAVYPASKTIYTFSVMPNIMLCSGMLIIAGCMFISISWTQKLPEKLLASFFIIVWSIFINHFGFTLRDETLAITIYFIGLFTVNLLMLILIIIYFKKLRFFDSLQSSRFRLLVENSSDSMFLYDYKRQDFDYISPTISQLIGISDSQLYEMPERFFDYVTIEKKESEIINIFSRPISHPGNGELGLYKEEEIDKWSEIHYLPIYDSTGTVSAVEGILRDITERKRMENDLQKMEQTKREFLENISHEIKTPVTLIQGYTESLLSKIIPENSTDAYLKMINSKAGMLSTLVDDLSQVSNITSQSLEYKFYEHNAMELMNDLLSQCEFQIASLNRQAIIKSNIDKHAILIVDPYRIQQVASNLINNAIRHTPIGNDIFVICETHFKEDRDSQISEDDNHNIPKGELLFTVSDTGDGIAENDIPRIFERSFSEGKKLNNGAGNTIPSDSSNPTEFSRSGVGLYIQANQSSSFRAHDSKKQCSGRG